MPILFVMILCGLFSFTSAASAQGYGSKYAQPQAQPPQMSISREEVEHYKKHGRKKGKDVFLQDMNPEEQDAYMAQFMSSPEFRKNWREGSDSEKKQFCSNAVQMCQRDGIMSTCKFHQKYCSKL